MARERRRATARGLLAAAAALIAVAVAVAPAYAQSDDQDDPARVEVGVGVSVKVLGPAASAPPTNPPALAPSGATTTPRGSSSTTTPNAVATDTAAEVPDAGDLAVAGGLYIGDINGVSAPTINPFDGRTELWFTVRNYSDETIDAAADFSLATAWGARIDGERVRLEALKAGEVRVVATTLHGSGQWPLVVGRVTFEPPATVAGQETAAVSRAATVFVLPWLMLIAGLLVTIAVVLLRLNSQVIEQSIPAVPAASAA